MTQPLPAPQSNTPEPVNQGPVIDDGGDVIRITVYGLTYVLRGDAAATVRANRAQYTDNSPGSSSFWHGFLTCLSLANSTRKERPRGEE